ncbi:MAG: AAA family ATPase [Phycisphaerales bacterium]|nr:AAA family ATPase [Phycisphaerales bacterium]
MNRAAIDKLTVKGFKSIRSLEELELRPLNVLIGSNGAGKSNFIGLFSLIRALAERNLQDFVSEQGRAKALLHLGPKVTSEITARVQFGKNRYSFTLKRTVQGDLTFKCEVVGYRPRGIDWYEERLGAAGARESKLHDAARTRGTLGGPHVARFVLKAIRDWVVYHFHDTTPQSGLRDYESITDNDFLRSNASNLAPYLLELSNRHGHAYTLVRDVVRLIAPFFDDFRLKPRKFGVQEQVRLEWRQRGSDYPFDPTQLSDGTLRFICLATALLQPAPPATMIFDEPELGLHPHALSVLAGLLRQASARSQIIVCTQSPLLVDEFEPADIVVVGREGGASTFHRLNAKDLKAWLEEYSLGELWQKNVIRGGPVHE